MTHTPEPIGTPGFLKIISMLLTFLTLRGLFVLLTGDFMVSLFPAWDTVILGSSYRIPIMVVLILIAGSLVAGVFFMVRKLVTTAYIAWKK